MQKQGTPTMGGLAFLISSVFVLFVSFIFLFSIGYKKEAFNILIALVFSASNSFIGIIDDRKKLKNKRNDGLTPKEKLIFQFSLSLLFLFMRDLLLGINTSVVFSFGEIDLGFLYYPLALVILVGITNCANLTDGIDGLASSVALAIGICIYCLSGGLLIDSAIICSVICGASIGFLLFNVHPARIFMGDTGSLFLGSLCASVAFSLDNPLIIVVIGGVYVIEGVSVILQVAVYKTTHKRLLKMAPLHHHLEKCGWSENKICLSAILVTVLLLIPALFIFRVI